ncbi:MAG: FAD binding domain-containing protein [Bosea sp. (in: a-proteobacteria)]
MTRLQYHRPTTLAEALAFRAAHDVQVLAGGTDVYPAYATRRAWGDPVHRDVLDISGLSELRGISEHADHWRLGALTTWTDLIRADLPPLFDGYRMAAREVGGVQIQNRGTLVGNICTASPAGDGIPCLLTLDAKVELVSQRGTRLLPLSDFIMGYRATATASDEIVTALLVPKADGQGRFLKLGARKYLVISIVMVAAVIEAHDGVISTARLAIGSCSAVAQRLTMLEQALCGQRLMDAAELLTADHLSALRPIDDIRSTGSYRQNAALTLTRDVLVGFGADAGRRAA